MRTLVVSVGGQGSRIRSFLDEQFEGLPKHLLPVPTEGKTLLGEIIHSAQTWFETIVLSVNTENKAVIAEYFAGTYGVNIAIDSECSGPLGPLVRNALATGTRSYGCAGDFFCQFSWEAFEHFHESHGKPVSLLVARSVPTTGGARFVLSNHHITDWERVDRTTEQDYINVGAYIVDPDADLRAFLKSMSYHKEDPFFDWLVGHQKVAGYNPGDIGFNINIATVYTGLLKHLQAK